jgi:hypothetical protein
MEIFMPKQKRFMTKYPGVYYIIGTYQTNEKPEKIYYIIYRNQNKLIEEKAGRQFKDDMTAARASAIRASKLFGDIKTNKEKREERYWTLNNLWNEYKKHKTHLNCLRDDE